MTLLDWIDAHINNITMYRLLLYGLAILAGLGITYAAFGVLSLPWWGLLVSLTVLLLVCYGANKAFSFGWEVGTNYESSLITALILFCIVPPVTTLGRLLAVLFVGLVAMASKYLLVFRRSVLFNPAAVAVVISGLLGILQASWWIGSPLLLPFVSILSLLVARKVRRMQMVLLFLIMIGVLGGVLAFVEGKSIFSELTSVYVSGPALFLGGIMLTEPATTPSRQPRRFIYSSGVALLFVSQIRTSFFFMTPEMALVIGNGLARLLGDKRRAVLEFVQKTALSRNSYDFSFRAKEKVVFQAGQYAEWTVPHRHVDDRGNRRTFTIASSPHEELIHLGVKFYEPSSSFKQALHALEPGDRLTIGNVGGDFVLPRNPTEKLICIAGGIGITPYRSMIEDLCIRHESRDIVLYYAISDPSELCYREVFEQAQKFGVRMVPILSGKTVPSAWKGYVGMLTPEIVQKETPDFMERIIYISGPNVMVVATRRMLRKLGVPNRRIRTDYFSGY